MEDLHNALKRFSLRHKVSWIKEAQNVSSLDDIDKLKGWPDSVKTMQRNWIDRSTGAILRFKVKEIDDVLATINIPNATNEQILREALKKLKK